MTFCRAVFFAAQQKIPVITTGILILLPTRGQSLLFVRFLRRPLMHHHAYKIYYCQMRGIKYVKDILHAHFAAKAAV